MSDETPNADALHEELVAYLDGELSAEQSRQLEERLSTDDAAREELQRLEKVWDILDGLPRANVNENFARTTVEMVTMAAQQDLAVERVELPKRNLRLWLATAIAVLLAGFIGFAGAVSFIPNKNSTLLHDLPTIDNLEMLQRADSVAFLQRLVDESVFPPEPDTPPVGTTAAQGNLPPGDQVPQSLAQRREWIDRLGETDRDRIQRMLERFTSLPVAEQDGLRALEAKLESSPELHTALHNYYEWLKNLQPSQRAELLALAPAKRFDEIQKVREEQAAQALRRTASTAKLTPSDWPLLFGWIDEIVQKHQAEILNELPPDRRKAIENLPENSAGRRRALTGAAMARWNSTGPDWFPQIDPGEMDLFIAKLSTDARAVLDKFPDRKDKIRVVREWAHNVARARSPQGRWGGFGNVSEAELTQFYEGLPAAEKDHLVNLPREEMHGELRKLYFQKHRGEGNQPFKGGDRPRNQGDRGQNDRGPNDRGPGEHGPNDHGPGEHGPNDHGPSEHGPNEHSASDHGASDHGAGERSAAGSDAPPAAERPPLEKSPREFGARGGPSKGADKPLAPPPSEPPRSEPPANSK
ncbi:MAG TPA: hypothetical protein VFE24_02245 [Pirellulales bacterium]|nr:hypothetical protein [Pirellulales bacterium]